MNGMLGTIIICLLTVAVIVFPYSLATIIFTYPDEFWVKIMYQPTNFEEYIGKEYI